MPKGASQDAREFHHSLIVVDGHCDTALDLIGRSYARPGAPPRDILCRSERGHIDLPRLEAGGVTCQTMALFVDDEFVREAGAHTHRLIDALEGVFERTDRFRPVQSGSEIRAAKAQGWTAALLAIEGGECIGESLDELRAFYKRGVRLVGLTWNRRNALGRGAMASGDDGLTPFGVSVIKTMERLGMLVDVSHLSDRALDDALSVAEKPLVASHSNLRALCGHVRNLKDAQVEAIARTGGLVALTFAGIFLDEKPAAVNRLRLLEHLDRAIALVGPDHVGLGSDFDGFSDSDGLAMASCEDLPELTRLLLERGYAPETVRKVMGENWLRVFEQTIDG